MNNRNEAHIQNGSFVKVQIKFNTESFIRTKHVKGGKRAKHIFCMFNITLDIIPLIVHEVTNYE